MVFSWELCIFLIMQGDEVSLQKALNMVHRNNHDYVAVLFYASWCPFSRIFRPLFSVLSSLHPSIPHFAIEESSVRPRSVSVLNITPFFSVHSFVCSIECQFNSCSILSKYGVHGFPTLFILNSTMRVRYHGSRTLGSLVGFYNDVTGKAHFRSLSFHWDLCSIISVFPIYRYQF